MLCGLHNLFTSLKEKGVIKEYITFEQFYQSKCWYSKKLLTEKQVEYNARYIFNGKNQ